MSDTIDYGTLMHNAMRSLIRRVLSDVSDGGLPGMHHFFITFDTRHPEAKLADWLKERYPSEMTIVIQHWFEDLQVNDDGFCVTLNFGDAPEKLCVPYDSIKTFVDPSVEFGLRFETSEDDDDFEDDDTQEPEELPSESREPTSQKHEADVVSLDQFRK
ncbi:SspB family protein [uncultured Lentibacter sp.]|jgi:hypothetical protein|uniref:SspB family protein n=1 Tax=uncultured Lentibacter sp. TaxID=1659309 RepID=UPI00262A1364|nr:ClpXP protease specificity-enhancing factor SspB [uncultured Lentibacter sp.]